MKLRTAYACVLYVFALLSSAAARDYFLTIGGGPSAENNQASLEKNVLSYQRVLKEQNVPATQQAVYFADGSADGKDVKVVDAESVPKANRLMAEFFGTERDLGLHYRNNEVPGIRGANTREKIQEWFSDVGRTLKSGDRLIVYVTAHGGRRVRTGIAAVKNGHHLPSGTSYKRLSCTVSTSLQSWNSSRRHT